MIKVLIPQKKGRLKTNIRGFWKSADNKIYYDYLVTKDYEKIDDVILDNLKKKYKQEAMAYYCDEYLCIYYDINNIKKLISPLFIPVNGRKLKSTIKKYINNYKGCTVYKINNYYYVEVYRGEENE